MAYTRQQILEYVGRLHDARLAEEAGDLEPMSAVFDMGPKIAWEACRRGWITFHLQLTDRGHAELRTLEER